MTAGNGAQPPMSVDILFVGSGPVGLYGAYYAGFRGFGTALIDSLAEVGGQISAMYPEKLIYDVAGLPAVRGRDLVRALRTQADAFNPQYLMEDQAVSLQGTPEGLRVGTRNGVDLICKALVITGGIGTFTPRKLPATGTYNGSSLHYFVTDAEEFRDQDVVIVGGGDSAFDCAHLLGQVARSTTLVHRRSSFRAHAHTVELVRASDTRIVTDAEVSHLIPLDDPAGPIEAVEIRNLNTGESWRSPAQKLVASLGFIANLGPLLTWGLELNERHIVVDTHMATNVAGVYAAGDISDYPGKVRLISVGFGEVATAVNNAAVLIDPSLTVFPGHSTELEPQTA